MTADTTSTVSHDIPKLLDLLRHQLALFEKLHRLSEEQGRAVREGPTDALLTLLARRQRFTDELTELQSRIEPFRRDWSKVRAAFAPSEEAEVDRLVDRCGSLLDEILSQDDRDGESLQTIHGRVGRELGKINHVGRALHAYTSQVLPADNRFTNRQG